MSRRSAFLLVGTFLLGGFLVACSTKWASKLVPQAHAQTLAQPATENKCNIFYFEAESLRGLYTRLDEWQKHNQKRFLSLSIHQDNGSFRCIALTNPMEVVITNESGVDKARISGGRLFVFTNPG
jgi:hypothetical protein